MSGIRDWADNVVKRIRNWGLAKLVSGVGGGIGTFIAAYLLAHVTVERNVSIASSIGAFPLQEVLNEVHDVGE
jgi:hypothetical protein